MRVHAWGPSIFVCMHGDLLYACACMCVYMGICEHIFVMLKERFLHGKFSNLFNGFTFCYSLNLKLYNMNLGSTLTANIEIKGKIW